MTGRYLSRMPLVYEYSAKGGHANCNTSNIFMLINLPLDSVKLVDLKIQLDSLRLEMDKAFANGSDLTEIRRLHFAIQKNEIAIQKYLPSLN